MNSIPSFGATVSVIVDGLHRVLLARELAFQVAAEVPRAVAFDPGEPVIVLLYLTAGALLLLGTRHPTGGEEKEAEVR